MCPLVMPCLRNPAPMPAGAPPGDMPTLLMLSRSPGNNRGASPEQEPGRGNHELRGQRLTVGQRDPPQLGMSVLPDAFDGGVEPHAGRTSYLSATCVVQRFNARPPQTAATSVGWLEPVGIRGRRLIDDQDVVVTQPFELDRRTDSAETRPSYDCVEPASSHNLQTVPHHFIVPDRLSADNARANVR